MSINYMPGTEIIEINSEQIDTAKLLASSIGNIEARKRGFVDMLGITIAKGYLYLKGIETDSSKSIYKILPLFEEFKITDIYYNGYRIDIITLYKEKSIKIPKLHVDMDIMPDFYFIVQIGSKIKEAKMIGFIDQRAIFSSPHDNRFYYPNMEEIYGIDKFYSMTRIMAPVKPTPTKHTETMELFLKFMDNELPSGYKRQLIKHLLDCPKCREKFSDTIEFEKLANNVSNYPEIVEKYKSKNIPISIPPSNIRENVSNSLEKSLENATIYQGSESFEQIDTSEVPQKDIIQAKPPLPNTFYADTLIEEDENIEQYQGPTQRKRNYVSYDRTVDFWEDDIQYKTSSTDNVPILDEDYNSIDNVDLSEIAKISLNENEKQKDVESKQETNELSKDVVKEYIKDVIQKTIKETIEENLKDAAKEENEPLKEEIKQEVKRDIEAELQEQKIREQNLVEKYKKEIQNQKPKSTPIEEPAPRKIEIIEYNPKPPEEPRKIELIDFDPITVEESKKQQYIKSIKDESKVISLDLQKEIKQKEIELTTPAGNELSKMVKSEAIEEIFDDAQKIELPTKPLKARGRKRFLIASIIMLLALLVISLVAIQGTNNMISNNKIQDAKDYEIEEEYDAQTMAYNQSEDGSITSPKANTVEDLLIKQPLPKQAYAPSISKISREAPESLVKKQEFTKFLQLIGKNIKLNLQNELLLVNDIPTNKSMKVDIKIAPTGDVVGINTALTSGSQIIDATANKVVQDTLRYIKPPSLGLRVQNSTITLTINLE